VARRPSGAWFCWRYWPHPEGGLYDGGDTERRAQRALGLDVEAREKWHLLVGTVYHSNGATFDVVPFSCEQTVCQWPQSKAMEWPPFRSLPAPAPFMPPLPPQPTIPFYDGLDGETLFEQPYHHRKRWTEEQTLAFFEFLQELEEEIERTHPGVLPPMIIKGE